jgi:hypothetical protein
MNTGAAQRGLGKLRASWGQIRTYADLQEQLHRDLMAQHPEWIEANGDCPTCDSYDGRLAELITVFQSAGDNSVTQVA